MVEHVLKHVFFYYLILFVVVYSCYNNVGDKMKDIQNDLKNIFYIGLGVVSTTGEKVVEMKDELLAKGKDLYDKGIVLNEELKHNMKTTLKKVNEKYNGNLGKDDILAEINKLSDEEKKSLVDELIKKGWNKDEGTGEKSK